MNHLSNRETETYRLFRMDWKIDFNRLQIRNCVNQESDMKSNLKGETSSTFSYSSCVSLSGKMFTQVAVLDGQWVTIKPINKPYLAVTSEITKEMNGIRNLKYKTINQLIGACVEPQKLCLIWAYCGKGSLLDVLQNDNIKLDWIFRISFISDIMRGMTYLHSSSIQCHGRLKSSNILIDNHWCCKVGDISMPLFRAGEKVDSSDSNRNYCNKLWTAPEILRNPEKHSCGTQKGDVYAFAIILQEIILRMSPYGNEDTDPEEIANRVKAGEFPPYRPNIPKGVVVDDLVDIIRSCWDEVPFMRPTFPQIAEQIRKTQKGKTTNIIEQMIHMLSKYANHLEDLVVDRTKQLEDEKKKTDDLLCRMLPSSIANDLKLGKTVQADYYDACTVFFSDIVGFTRLASESTPFEIVDFLNHLYTTFDSIIDKYDVYKVETISDSYMVASGLPTRNGNRHAGEIGTMALDMLASMSIFTIKHRPDRTLQLRTGMHTGPVAAGVVGMKMPRYCLFGDTVNYASRMESSGLALRIHVSPECKAVLDQIGGYQLESRGFVTMKGKGSVSTFFLVAKNGFKRLLPSLSLQAPLSEHCFK